MLNTEYRIPIIDTAMYEGVKHGDIPLNRNDPRFFEPLVNLEEAGIAFSSYHAIADGSNPPFGFPIPGSSKKGWLRKSLIPMLINANKSLEKNNVELIVIEAYRSMECQWNLWEYYINRASKELGTDDNEVCTTYALRFLRDPREFVLPDGAGAPSHATGGSIDVLLRYADSKKLLNMGSGFEQEGNDTHGDFYERQLLESKIGPDDERLLSRRLVHCALSAEGFYPNPRVFWHYDWGNRHYVKYQKIFSENPPEAAWYGYVLDPESERCTPNLKKEIEEID